MDWHAWHNAYDIPDSYFGQRLALVQHRIRLALDTAPPGPLTAVSLCAGQGRDLIGVLADHPRRSDVRARLVELDERNATAARRAAAAAGLSGVEVVVGDASLTDHYAGLVPADLVLVCGTLGNITDADVERTLDHCTQLCRRGGTVVWTRNRKAPDLVPQVCAWLEERGFERLWVSDPALMQGVGAHRFTGEPRPLARGERMFTFVGYDTLRRGTAGGSRQTTST
ncbi:SAM-dependent methyltransferase [Streptomyces sp. F001]|uniref:class I SAM-dependent methyltransferase family protein n=1 Tax=Streptomyces sp. F001 TaxID=1510026 RepID=UPI00101E22EF|nr:class I SAM-dependent methyltransferase family protein [Streptomyces sp. F001]RZB18170.1 SAM-dependent methyltransferase [Streptomyces sp. F001]